MQPTIVRDLVQIKYTLDPILFTSLNELPIHTKTLTFDITIPLPKILTTEVTTLIFAYLSFFYCFFSTHFFFQKLQLVTVLLLICDSDMN